MEENDRRRNWEKPGKKLEPCTKTGSAGDVLWTPYAPEGAKGNKSSQVKSSQVKRLGYELGNQGLQIPFSG
jgi:hypothetical protein